MALAIVLISVTFNVVGAYWLVPIFLFMALVIGSASGLGRLAFQDLIGRILSDELHRKLLILALIILNVLAVVYTLRWRDARSA